MARSNPDVIRDALDVYRREGFPALARFAHPDVEVRMGEGINAGEYRGIDEAIRFNDDWEDVWENADYEITEIDEVDERNAVVKVDMRMRGWGSGLELTVTAWWLFEIRDERFVRWHLYTERDSALAAASE